MNSFKKCTYQGGLKKSMIKMLNVKFILTKEDIGKVEKNNNLLIFWIFIDF